MAGRRKSERPLKSTIVTFRLPADERMRLAKKASNAGMTLTELITACLEGRVSKVEDVAAARHANDDLRPLPPEVFAELRRIGNNVNQIAHAVNSGLPPELRYAYGQAARLVELLIADELSLRRKALRTRTSAHGSAHSQTGSELQGGVRLYPARRRTKEDS